MTERHALDEIFFMQRFGPRSFSDYIKAGFEYKLCFVMSALKTYGAGNGDAASGQVRSGPGA